MDLQNSLIKILLGKKIQLIKIKIWKFNDQTNQATESWKTKGKLLEVWKILQEFYYISHIILELFLLANNTWRPYSNIPLGWL